jgi:serine/threonine-protein kinase
MAAASATEMIGDYALEAELGRGAHGVVYRARHRDRPDAPVALKVVAGRGGTDRLLLEPAVLSRLDHPNIVGIEDYFLRGDELVLALEYVEGESLQTLLDRGERLGQSDVRELLVQLASALAQAHAKNVIHRDVKPSNILLVREADGPRFVLTDFGIGQLAEGIQTQKRQGGTYSYMAPEQLRGRPVPQSDLWALGVVAYRLLAGRLPFPGPTLTELAHQIQYAAPPPPRAESGETLDPTLERAVLRLLDKSLEERVASAEELLRLLGQRDPSIARTARRRRPVAAASVSLDRRIARGIRNRRAAIAVCVVLYILPGGLFAGLLTLAGLVLFVRFQSAAKPSSTPSSVAGTVAVLLLLGGALYLRYRGTQYDVYPFNTLLTGMLGGIARLSSSIPVFLQIVLGMLSSFFVAAVGLSPVYLPAIGGAFYATLRRLHRESLLRDVARDAGPESAFYLQLLSRSLDSRFEDVGLHLKYAEALFARGKIAEAAVESRLLLVQDAYHFNGNLLLANAYFQLGLYEECAAVCEDFLKVSGHCFEFGDLLAHARRRLTARETRPA